MDALVRYFSTRHLLVNVAALGMIVLGFISANQLQREFIPAFDTPIVWITAQLPGASARDIETKITIPLEDALDDVNGIKDFYTVISDHTSFTTVELYDDYDSSMINEAKQDLREAIDSVTDFPPEMEDRPVLRHLNPAQAPVIEVNISGPEVRIIETAKLLEKRIERLPHISSVDALGLNDPEVRILVDPEKLLQHDITLQTIISAVERRNVSSTGGALKAAQDNRQVVMWSRFENPEDVGETILQFGNDGFALKIKDVARIEHGFEDRQMRVHSNAERGITLLANKREKADIINAARAVHSLLEDIEIPDGVSLTTTHDESFRVANRLTLIATNGLIGGLLVAITLFAFLQARAALWIIVAIPVVFFAGILAIRSADLTINFATLSGLILVLGMVVDDAVVVSERIMFKQTQGLSPGDAAVKGTLEMMRPVIAAALTTMLAFSPVLSLGGLPGKIIWQVPFVVIVVLLLSLLESFFILPAHMSYKASDATLKKRSWMLELEKRYRALLQKALRNRRIIVLIALAVFFGIMIFIRPNLPFVIFPQDDASRLFVKVTTKTGTPLEKTEAIVTQLERQIIDITAADLDSVVSRIGHQETLVTSKDVGDADNEAVIIVDFHKIDRQYTNVEWMSIIREQLSVVDDVDLVFLSEYEGPPTDQPVTIHVLSNDDIDRRNTAYDIARYLETVEGVVNIDVDERPGMPQLDLNLDYTKLARLGLDAHTVGQTLSAAFYGLEATEHRELEDTTEIRVMLEPAARADLDALMEIPLRAADGSLVRLRDVVNPVEDPSVTRIYHRNGFRSSTIRANFSSESNLTALPFARGMEEEVFVRYQDIPGLEVYNGGEAVETEETAGNIGVAALIAISSIGVVIWLMLGSLLEAAFILVAIPFALAGVILIFFLHGQTASMFTAIGAIGLSGVVVNASIIMMDSIHRATSRLKDDDETKREEAVLDAIVERLRPILITSLTTLLAVLPSAYGIGGYDTFVANISLAMGWGLVFSTSVTLFLVPVLYSLADEFNRRRAGKFPARG